MAGSERKGISSADPFLFENAVYVLCPNFNVQIKVVNEFIELETGEVKKMTDIALGADGVLWSPDGKYLAIVSQVYPDCPDKGCLRFH